MAELVLYIGDQPAGHGFKDGDICDCFNDRRVLCCHAEHICSVREAGFNSDGLRPANSLARTFQSLVYQYKFSRVSRTEVARLDISTGNTEIFGEPNIFVEEYIEQRLSHSGHKIYGARGQEFWYGGRRNVSDDVVNSVWHRIETQSRFRRADHLDWPLTQNELRFFLTVPTDNFDDDRSLELVSSVHDGDPETDDKAVLVSRRNHCVHWRDVLGLSGPTKDYVPNREVVVEKPTKIRHPLSVVSVK